MIQIHNKRRIALVGCDLDLVDEISSLTETNIIGYFSNAPKTRMPFDYLGNILDCIPSELVCDNVIVGCDDVFIRNYCMSKLGSILTSYISPNAYVSSSAFLGKGSVVMANCYVSGYAQTGICSKLNIGVQMHHEASVGNCSVISPQTVLLGKSYVGNHSLVGASCVIRNSISIGDHCLIGMGSIVVKNIGNNILAYGVPCKPIKYIDKS